MSGPAWSVVLVFAADAELSAALALMAVGMAVVFTALVLLLGAIAVLNRLGGEEPVATPSSPAPAETRRADGAPEPRLVAVLAAAATVALERPVRITAARRRGQDERRS